MPSRAATVSNRAPVPTHLRPPRLVGREEQASQLAAALACPPAVVLVEGEAGIGKTRLVTEYLATTAAGRGVVLVASCPPFRQPLTLGPVTDALRQAAPNVRDLDLSPLAGVLRPLFPEWADALPPAPEPLEDATAVRHRLFTALAGFLDRLAVSLLVVEDAHWADEATLEFLLFLTARHPQPLNLLLTYRLEDIPPDSLLRRLSSRLPAGTASARITLGSLDVTATAALVSSMLGGKPVSGEFAAFLHEHAEGLPLAVEETVRLMADREDLEFRADGWMRRRLGAIAVPPTVRDAVLERAERLEVGTQVVLQAAGVMARPASEPVLRVVSGLDGEDWRDGLAGALGCGLLTEIGEGRALGFRHALAARAVYEAVPSPLRREMHQRAGQALQDTPSVPPALLARHFHEAGDVSLWCLYGEQAADLALASGDQNTAATLLYDLITTAALSPADMARLTGKIHLAMLTDVHDLISALRSILDSDGIRPGQKADLRFQLGRVLISGYDWASGSAELERAIPRMGHDPVAMARAMVLLGWPFGTDRPGTEHLRWLSRTHEIEDALPEVERLQLMVDRATALLFLGEQDGWAESERAATEAATREEQFQLIRVCMNTAEAAMRWGRYAEARNGLARGAERASQGEYGVFVDDAAVTGAHLDWFTGAWQGLADRIERLPQAGGFRPSTHAEAVLVAGLLHAAQGADDAARGELERVLDEQTRRGLMLLAMEPAAWLSRMMLADGRVEDALALTEEPMRILTAKRVWLWATEIVPVRVQALIAAGRPADASVLTAGFMRGLRGRSAPAPKAALGLSRALLAKAEGRHVRAAVLFERAADAWQALPRPYDALLAREQQARCLLTAGERDAGLERLGEVLRGLSGLGATSDTGRVTRLLRDHGVKVAGRAGRRSYGDRLSPREIEVVRLVVDGHTNREIADSLFLSVPTVVHHVESARRKLKAPSRTALAVTALENGLVASGQ